MRPQIKKFKKRKSLKIQKHKEIHVSGKNLEKKLFSGMSAPTPIPHAHASAVQAMTVWKTVNWAK